MTYLELCERTRQECDITGLPFASVVAQIGEYQRIVNWVSQAYLDIQNAGPRWDWLWRPFTVNLLTGGRVYDPVVDWTITPLLWNMGFEAFQLYQTAIGENDKVLVAPLDWELFRACYESRAIMQGRPVHLVVKPNRHIAFNCTLDRDYTFVGEYYSTAEEMVADTDEPSMPEQYHMGIVWKAVMKYAAFEEDANLFVTAQGQYRSHRTSMRISEMQPLQTAGPMA